MNDRELRFGVIGFGGFAQFAVQQFVQVAGAKLVGMAGTHREAAYAAARRFGVEDVQEVDALLARTDVELIYIATPPALHHAQALAALRAGKHVISEKPLAMTTVQADELVAEARRRDLLVIANLMQRYNPLFDAVKALVDERLLGDVLHGYFENYAADEGLGPQHWFWDRSMSGGIFIEHGVHFFDLLAGWLGPGDVVAAQVVERPADIAGASVEDQVHATVRYARGPLVNFYHGFHQPGRLDRQELRLVFERGDLTLHGWIPTRYRLHAIADEAQTRRLCELFPDGRLDATETYAGAQRACRGRFQQYDVYQHFELHGGDAQPKLHCYGDLLRAMLADQMAWIADRSHVRRITEANGRDSVAMAERADELAHAPSAQAEP
jgi:predicted dehydrogenase